MSSFRIYYAARNKQTFAAEDQDGGDVVNIINKRVYKRKTKLDKPIVEAIKEKTAEKIVRKRNVSKTGE